MLILFHQSPAAALHHPTSLIFVDNVGYVIILDPESKKTLQERLCWHMRCWITLWIASAWIEPLMKWGGTKLDPKMVPKKSRLMITRDFLQMEKKCSLPETEAFCGRFTFTGGFKTLRAAASAAAKTRWITINELQLGKCVFPLEAVYSELIIHVSGHKHEQNAN